MNKITAALTTKYHPQLLIAVYTEGDDEHIRSSSYYLEAHEVDSNGRVLEGKPLKMETIQGMVEVFYNEHKQRTTIEGLQPANMLLYREESGGAYNMIWYRPAEYKTLYFSESLKIPDGRAHVPALLYRAKNGSLDVYALDSDERPDEKTKLYNAPFHNVSSSGDVCLGSGKVKMRGPKSYDTLIKYWEDMFWMTKFSHLNGGYLPTNTNLNILWKRLIKDNTITWNAIDELKLYADKTLKDLL